ncbi:obscurin-like isoform X3 [Takifugu flavidus]|uniref:obscurin-like isoform X3 n=1 Tax=Takifugu flavidus TaxID=433684 RepID=UPI0025449781|nr:obscurin-like isoform X3 [Takifugu flavidus]
MGTGFGRSRVRSSRRLCSHHMVFGRRRLQPGAKYGMEEWGTKRRLTIRDIGVDDDGIYLCEMPDGGRSIAEVAVKGTILRKLPRKVDVLEGENAAYCVEVEKEEMDIHWYKDGVELRETHQTIIKSFGRTHILVFVNTMPQDSGLVTFLVGRSKTSSQLRVKAARHCPPSCPVGVQINTERANAALLSWVPAQDSRRNPPAGYVLERQEVGTGSQEWLQCLTTDSATSVEILGDSVPCEADYRFRICSVNKYGKSNNVEFPRGVHLVPVARIQAPLQDALVPEGQDAHFSIELSASVIGTWFLNGTQLQEDERYSMRRTRTHQSLRIRGVRDTDNGAEITFIAYGIRDSAAMYIQAPLVKFSPLSEMDRNKFVEIGNPIVLYCELSDPAAPVHWYKNGVELQTMEGLHIQSEGTMRRIVIQSAEFSHSGVYCCDAIDDVIRFNVEVEAPPVRFSAIPDAERNKTVQQGCPIVLQCELSDPCAQVYWYKDGSKLLPQPGVDILTDGFARKLIIPTAEFFHTGLYCCKTKGDSVLFNVDVKAPPVKFSAIPEELRTKWIEAGCPLVLQCVVSDAEAHVCWYRDEMQLIPHSGLEITSEGNRRTLVVQCTEVCHSGVYRCTTQDDTMDFQVEIKAKPSMPNFEVEGTRSVQMGKSLELDCEVADSSVPVCWYKDGVKLLPQHGWETQSNGTLRRLVIPTAELLHAGLYSCESSDDTIHFTVDIKAPPLPLSPSPDVVKTHSIEATSSAEPTTEASDPAFQLSWHRDQEHDSNKEADFELGGIKKTLVTAPTQPSNSGPYYSATTDAVTQLIKNEASSPTNLLDPDGEKTKSAKVQKAIVRQFEISDPIAKACWYKDGTQIYPKSKADCESQSSIQTLPIQALDLPPDGGFGCKTFGATQSNVAIKAEQFQYGDEIGEVADASAQYTMDDKAPPVRITTLCEAEKKKSVEAGEPLMLRCEISDPNAQVTWYKDGVRLHEAAGHAILAEASARMLMFGSAVLSHAGIYCCKTRDDAVAFHVDVKAQPARFSYHQESDRNICVHEGSPIVLRCELSHDPSSHVDWTKDGIKLLPQNNMETNSEGLSRTLHIHSAEKIHAGVYECSTSGHTITFEVDVKGRSPQIMPIPPSEKYRMVAIGCPIILQCEVSDPAAQVSWFKDGGELYCKTGLDMKRDGSMRKLIIQSAKLSDSGIYGCSLTDDVVTFHVDVKATPVKFSALPEVVRNKFVEAGCPIQLQCEVSEPSAQVYWHKDGDQLPPQSEYEIQTKEKLRALLIKCAEVRHSGLYSCEAEDDHIEFKVDVAAPPVTFADIAEEDLFKTVVEQEELLLTCEVSRVDGVVQWYKDGAELQQGHNTTIQADGTKRNLTINSAQLSDMGTYTCRAGDNVIMFKVNIREPPVTIIHPREDVHLERHVPEEIILSCELSRPNGVVSWYKDGQKLQESENIKLKIEGPYRRLKILCSRAEDSGEYVCDTADDSIFFHLNITEPPVRILSPSQSQMELCQQTSERMVLSCEISRPNAVVRWYRNGLEVEENNNLILEVDGVYRRLIIPKTTVKDSAEYVCDTTDDSMTFFVNIAEPPVRFIRSRKMTSTIEKVAGETLVLDCEVSRSNAEVTWKRNGEEIEDSRNITILEDGVMRQLTVHSLTVDHSGQYVCDAKDDVMDFLVKIKELPVKILGKTDAKTEKQFLVSDDIILVCELSRSNASVRWYKDDQLIEDSEHYCSEEQGVFRSLVVLNAGIDDSGKYTCDAVDDKMVFFISVKEPPVQIIGNSGHPEHHTLVAGDDLILECEVSRPSATVQWLRNGKILKPGNRVTIDRCDVVRKLVLSGLQPSDSGTYVCDAIDDQLVTVVEVQAPPVKFVNKEASNEVSACESESVTLRAVVNWETANVRWLKDGQLLDKENIHISSEGKTHKLTINPLQLSDSGEYVCDVNTDEMHFSLSVKEMMMTFTRPLEDTASLKGSSLTLRCEINKLGGDVQWLKDGQEICPGRRHTIRAQGRERSITIHQLMEQDSGEYVCESTHDRTAATVTVEIPRVVEILAELRNITVCEGEDAVFKCVVSPEDARLVWRFNGKQVTAGGRVVISSNGLCHMLCIHNCTVSDSTRVTAEAEGLVSEAELQVQEQQVIFTKKMLPVTAEEYSEATLEVEVSLDTGEVQWMRQGVLIHPGAKCTLKHKGRKRSLTIHNLAVSDRGTYSCETLHDRTQTQLTVEPRKITIKRGLTDIKTTERETATFEVELSHPQVVGMWMRNGIQLKQTNHFRMSAKGKVHSLTVSNLSIEDTGTFMFCVERQKTSARLVVKEPPVTIVRKLQDQRVSDGAVISIECELSRHNVDVKWTKNGTEIKPSKDLRIYAMGRKRFLQILKCNVVDSGIYTCDAGDTTTSCNVEVYERELLITQGLNDLDIQEDQNAVFICELTVEDIPGEWYKNGERIQPTSTVKIRQEGTKHFLLMCNVRPEDSGEIKFIARRVESVAYLDVEELPVNIVKPLEDKTALEMSRVILDCTVSNPRCSIRWYKGCTVILPSERFEICSEGGYRKLIIQQVALDDAGTYSVQVGEYSCSAKLTVEAQPLSVVRELVDVEVTAPDEARFECEVSAPVVRTTEWSLNGERLKSSSCIRVEKMGAVHRLILKQTSTDMSGAIEFTCGKAKSRAQLQVLSGP